MLAYRRWLIEHHPAEPHRWIGPVAVEPDLRRRGIGTELLRRLLDDLRVRGGGEVWLEAEPENEPLYLRLGFEIVERDHDPDGIAFAFMRLALRAGTEGRRGRVGGRSEPTAPRRGRRRAEGSA